MGSIPKLPRHTGRLRTYEAWRIHVYRQPVDILISPEGAKAVPKRGPNGKPVPPELVAIIGPYYVKERAELQIFYRQFAYANRTMGRYDWLFKAERLGLEQRKTMEELGRDAQNGQPCKRCRRMTTNAELCDGCLAPRR